MESVLTDHYELINVVKNRYILIMHMYHVS